MMFFLLLLIGIPYVIYILYVIITAIRTMLRNDKNKLSVYGIASMLIADVIFTVIAPAIGFCRFDAYGPNMPFARHHVISIILLVMASSLSFWCARLTAETRMPLLRILFSVGMLQGILLCFITTIHFMNYFVLGIIFPFEGFELLCPLVAFFLLIREFYFYNKTESISAELLPYREMLGFIPLPLKIIQLSMPKRIVVYSGLLVIAIALQVAFLYAFGQDADSIVKAFRESSGFIFSKPYSFYP
ncbi:MAG: hypothetical protein JWO44_1313 [Bacteroidetes bacterium]|nr:hypothetical protein [Bacteroidota bacterium]